MTTTEPRHRRSGPLVVLLALSAPACIGTVGPAGDTDREGSAGLDPGGERPDKVAPAAGGSGGSVSPATGVAPPPVPPTSAPAACAAPRPGPIVMRRLTRRQYLNAVRDLFGVDAESIADFPETTIHRGYRSFTDANNVTADGAEDIAQSALAVAQKAAANLPALLGCTPGTANDDRCVRDGLARLARRAYRRPADAAELQVLNKGYADLRGLGLPPADAVGGVLEALLQSPQFLYLSEVGRDPAAAPGSVQPLTDHEIAARLSFGLLDTPPDDELSRLADEGKLRTREAVEAQARRLAADRRALSPVAQFLEDWLELYRLAGQSRDPQRFPEWSAALPAALRGEVGAFATEVMTRGDRRLSTLLSAPWTMAGSLTAPIYGVPKPASTAFTRVELDPARRAGLLTSAAFLASHAGNNESLPVVRGAMVRRHLFCMELEVPPGLEITSPAPDINLRTRERFAQHSTDPACSGCHALMDPIGFGLENYDALGRYRTTEGKALPIDASGKLEAAGDANGPFTGGVELARKLAGSATVQACFARQMFSYLNARPFDETADRCALDAIGRKLADASGDLVELLVAIATSDPFLYRLMPERGAP